MLLVLNVEVVQLLLRGCLLVLVELQHVARAAAAAAANRLLVMLVVSVQAACLAQLGRGRGAGRYKTHGERARLVVVVEVVVVVVMMILVLVCDRMHIWRRLMAANELLLLLLMLFACRGDFSLDNVLLFHSLLLNFKSGVDAGDAALCVFLLSCSYIIISNEFLQLDFPCSSAFHVLVVVGSSAHAFVVVESNLSHQFYKKRERERTKKRMR